MNGVLSDLNDLLATHGFPPIMHTVNASISHTDSYLRREEMIQEVVIGLRIPLTVLTHERHQHQPTGVYTFTALPR
jgi:hypothetical protein